MALLWVRKGKKCGKLLFYASSGLFGRKETVELLKTRGIQSKGSGLELRCI